MKIHQTQEELDIAKREMEKDCECTKNSDNDSNNDTVSTSVDVSNNEIEITSEIRNNHFNETGMYCYDDEIIRWYKSSLNQHPLSKEFKSVAENNGGSTDYYKFKADWKECGDIIEARGMNYNQGNIFKSAFCFNIGRHNGTDYERELNKIIYFAQRELDARK